MANSNNWGEIYKSTWWGDEDWSANSLKIDSAPPGFAFTGLLDTYTGAAAAYSVRKLSSTYAGSALRVRKEVSSVDEETDIGFNASNELDTAALLSFASDADGGNVYVSVWYDQSGNGNDATNANESEQPLIVDGGTLVEEDGKAAIQFDGVDDMLQKDIDPDIAQPLTLFHVRRYRSNGTYCAISYDNTTGTGYADINVANDFRSYYGSYLGTTTQNTNKGLWYSLANGTSSEVGLDGATAETGNAGTQGLEVLTIGSAFGAFDAPINTQEIIIFNSDQSSNRGTVTTGGGTLIEGNINTYFNIV